MTEKILDVNTADKTPVQCHSIPCRIEYDGNSIRAKEYFWPTIKELQAGGDDDDGREPRKTQQNEPGNSVNPILTASFRGRPLQGRKVNIPDGYKGCFIHRDPKEGTTQFDSFTYWNWDEIPTSSDDIVKSLGWLNVSKAIHCESGKKTK